MLTSMFFKLCARAPLMSMKYLGFIRFSGTGISNLPVKYLAVRASDFKNCSGVPAATTSPPKLPANGPISMR